MIEAVPNSAETEKAERLETIWQSAIDQKDGGKTKAALEKADKNEALKILGDALERMESFENAADLENKEIEISKEVADRIGALWIFSGVGTYDKPLPKAPKNGGKGDNPALIKEFLHGSNRRRIMHGMLIARRIAEVRSGKKAPIGKILGDPKNENATSEELKAFMKEYAPYIVFGGLIIENEDAREVLSRPTYAMPAEKVLVIEPGEGMPEWKTTTDQVKNFMSPNAVRDMEVGMISDGTHLNRILQIAGKSHDHLPEGKPVHLFPSPTPKEGRREFQDMEGRGLLAYVYRDEVAAKEPYPYTLDHISGK